MKIPHLLLAAFSLLLFSAGCESFYLSQSEMFIDEDGSVISVQYGKIDGEYHSTFTTPNGRTHDYHSSFSVRVVMPDGSSFQGYQVFNELMRGALYRSSNEKWAYHATGNTCTVYERIEDKLYKPVFVGVVCRGQSKEAKEQRR